MHYHKSKFLRFANAAFEFLLLILTFIFAGWLRSYTPMGSQFFMWDIWTFLPISALYALVIVGCNAVLGSYRTLHLRNSIKQLFLIALTSLMGLALMAVPRQPAFPSAAGILLPAVGHYDLPQAAGV